MVDEPPLCFRLEPEPTIIELASLFGRVIPGPRSRRRTGRTPGLV